MTTIAVIPARGGSKRVPRKNIRTLGGIPLIAHSIIAARNALINDVYVSTEDEAIAAVAKQFGAKVLARPAILATDEVQLEEVMLYSLRQLNHELGVSPDVLVLIQASSPFKTGNHLNEALQRYHPPGTMFSACQDDKFHWKSGEWSVVPVEHDPARRFGRQWMKDEDLLYAENGCFYIFPAERLSLEKSVRLSPFTIYPMSVEDSLDIDTEYDFWLAEQRIKHESETRNTR